MKKKLINNITQKSLIEQSINAKAGYGLTLDHDTLNVDKNIIVNNEQLTLTNNNLNTLQTNVNNNLNALESNLNNNLNTLEQTLNNNITNNTNALNELNLAHKINAVGIETGAGVFYELPFVFDNQIIRTLRVAEGQVPLDRNLNLIKECDTILHYTFARKKTDGHWYYGSLEQLGIELIKRTRQQTSSGGYYKEGLVALKVLTKQDYTDYITATLTYTKIGGI